MCEIREDHYDVLMGANVYKILVIEDDSLCGYQICELLSRFGYSAELLTQPQDLFVILELFQFSLVLLDFCMPAEDGLCVLKKIKKHPVHRNLPVIMLTGVQDNPDLLPSCFAQGAADFLSKPISLRVMKARIAVALKQAEISNALRNTKKLLSQEQEKLSSLLDKYLLLKQKQNSNSKSSTSTAPKDPLLSEAPIQPDLRYAMVDLLHKTLEVWSEHFHKSKNELAEESKFWSIYMEKSGVCRTRTLDRYLCVNTLPKNPHWKNVLQTAYFVLEELPQNSDYEKRLKNSITNLEHHLNQKGLFI